MQMLLFVNVKICSVLRRVRFEGSHWWAFFFFSFFNKPPPYPDSVVAVGYETFFAAQARLIVPLAHRGRQNAGFRECVSGGFMGMLLDYNETA